MEDIILKEDAINIIKDVVGNNQGCSEIFLFNEYRNKGGTYQIHGRNDSTSLTFEEVLRSMVDLKMLLKVEPDNSTSLYYLTNFIEKTVTVSLPYVPTKCQGCRFVAKTSECPMSHSKTFYTCLLDLHMDIENDIFKGSKKNLYCPFNK